MILIEKAKFRTDEKVLVECDFKISLKCKQQYCKLYKNILIGRKNNNGKDRCCFCFNSLTKAGTNNYNFKYEKDEKFFEYIDTELKAYLLGWIAEDGCLKKDGLFLEIHKDDIEILELFKNNIAPNAPFYKHSDPIRGENTICWKVHSVKIVKDLLGHLKLKSVGKKSDKIQFPNLNKEFLWHFVRGLLDSDGNIASPFLKKTCPNTSICSISPQMKIVLVNFCNKNHIKSCWSKNYHNIRFTGHNCLLFLDKIYNNANYFLTRKKAYYDIWKTWIPYYGTSIKFRKIRKKNV